MEEERKQRGGAREGAARKSKGTEGTLRVGFRCSQDVWDILQLQKEKPAFIEEAIRENGIGIMVNTLPLSSNILFSTLLFN